MNDTIIPIHECSKRWKHCGSKSQGEPHNKIAQLTGVSINVVTQYIKEYQAGGIEKLKEVSVVR